MSIFLCRKLFAPYCLSLQPLNLLSHWLVSLQNFTWKSLFNYSFQVYGDQWIKWWTERCKGRWYQMPKLASENRHLPRELLTRFQLCQNIFLFQLLFEKKTGQKILADTVNITFGIGFNVQKDSSQTTWIKLLFYISASWIQHPFKAIIMARYLLNLCTPFF